MSEKIKSRKLWAFIGTALIILANYLFTLGMPSASMLYLVIASASYILGQGYVDAKQQPVQGLPVTDVTNALSGIIQTELAKFPITKELPLDELMTMFKGILSSELSKINTFTIAPTVPVVAPAEVVVPVVSIPADVSATTVPAV